MYRGTGPIAALPLDSADPDRDAAFWAGITGWVPWAGLPGAATLRHPSGVGPLLELHPEPGPKRGRTGCTSTSAPAWGTTGSSTASWNGEPPR